MTVKEMRKRRDAKVRAHLEQYAPVWLESETFLKEVEAVLFNVVFRHPSYGWVSRRYRYDSFNDVLYYKGQRVLDEEAVLPLLETEPYLDAVQANIPNSYGG
ncbi:MAG: hypothetical protein JW910_03210 [Anaerolineae bacterium]|nr:hypothetical protein [Anaerolineae bacterium]